MPILKDRRPVYTPDSLPVYSTDRELIYYARLSRVPDLISSGRVRPLGNSKRGVRQLVAICDPSELLRLEKAKGGIKFSDKYETIDNPAGVWHFKRRSFDAAA